MRFLGIENAQNILGHPFYIFYFKGTLSLLLISDWLIRADTSPDAIQLPYRCFDFLQENSSLEKLKLLMEGKETVQEDAQKDGDAKESRTSWEFVREECPYCFVPVSLTTLSSTKCSNGHSLQRCSLTLQLSKSVTKFRYCLGCKRKVNCKNFEAELSIESILLNVDICPFCGCRFVEELI